MQNLRVIFMGTPDFSVPVLEALIKNTHVVLVVTQPDKEVGRHHTLTFSPVKEVALKNNIAIFQPSKIRMDYEMILKTPCDIIITCAYGQIIPKVILDYPYLSCINVHASLLPKYRGGAPIHRAIMNGEKTTGITIMYMDELMDNGDIIKEVECPILETDTMGSMFSKLSLLGANLLIETLPSIMAERNDRVKQDESKVTFAYAIKREEERIDFSKKGESIINQIRGLNPSPYANFLVNHEEWKVVEATFVPTPSVVSKVTIDDKAIGIGCQNGVIYLTKVKPFGKKIMTTKDYLNGQHEDRILKWKINEE